MGNIKMKFINSLALIIISLINLAFSKKFKSKTRDTEKVWNTIFLCKDVKLTGSVISALCEMQGDRADRHTSANLQHCIGNNDGHLTKGADFFNSCSDCYIFGTDLKCQCQRRSGRKRKTVIDLWKVIQNKGGIFHGAYGTDCNPHATFSEPIYRKLKARKN